MKRSDKRILTTHVGSIVRLRALLESQKANSPTYEQELTQAVARVVEQQARAGIDIVNDGEFGKSQWANYILSRLTGFEYRPDKIFESVWLGRDRIRFAEFMAELTVAGPVTVSGLWQGSTLSLSFEGDVSEPDRQRIRNFLLATLA